MSKVEVKVAVGYIRVSTEEQVNGTSLDSQGKAIQEYAKRQGIELPDENIFCEEGVSAKLIDRPELAKMLNYCAANKGNVTHCIVWKVDRLARKLEYHLAIKASLAKYGVRLVSVTEPIDDNPMGSLMENVLAAFAQFDNEIRLVRTMGGMKARAQQGGWPHDAPIGYKKWRTPSGVSSVEPEDKRDMAQKVADFLVEFSNGSYSVEQARNLAFETGVRDKNGRLLRWQTIKNMLTNPLYAGFVQSKFTDGNRVKGVHKPLIDERTFYKNQSILLGHTKSLSKQAEVDWPLRGGFVQHTCGNPLTGGNTSNRPMSGSRYACSHCRAKELQRPVSTQREVVHHQFLTLMSDVRPTDGVQRLFREIVLRAWNNEFKEALVVSSKVDSELASLRDKKSRIVDLYIDGKLSDDEKQEKLRQLDVEAGKLELQRIDADNYVSEKEHIIDAALLFMSDPAMFWNLANLPIKKRIQDLIFPEGLVYDCMDGFRTPTLSNSYLLIKKIASEDAKNPTLVAASGFEPLTSGL
jgi:site-specific DNA recombinase